MCRLSFAFFHVSHVFLSTRTVEATTLNSRCYNLQPQDEFLRDNMSEEDILIVSIGGNDVALAPAPCTIASMAGLTCCLPTNVIEHGFSCCAIPVSRNVVLEFPCPLDYERKPHCF